MLRAHVCAEAALGQKATSKAFLAIYTLLLKVGDECSIPLSSQL